MMIGLDSDTVRALLSHPTRLAILAALGESAMWTTAEIAKATAPQDIAANVEITLRFMVRSLG